VEVKTKTNLTQLDFEKTLNPITKCISYSFAALISESSRGRGGKLCVWKKGISFILNINENKTQSICSEKSRAMTLKQVPDLAIFGEIKTTIS